MLVAPLRLGTIIAGVAPNPRRHPIATNKPSTSAAGDRPLPPRAPHKPLAQVEHPAGRSRMLVAVHGLAVRSASDAIRAPLTELLKPDGCRAPPRGSHRAAGARHHQRLARARPRSSRLTRAISVEPSMPPAPPPFRGASETERSQRSPSQNDTDVAGWRRVSCWLRRCALGPSSPAWRRILAATRSPPTNHRRRLPATVHCHPERRTSRWRRSSTPQVDLACSSLSTGSPSAQRAMP